MLLEIHLVLIVVAFVFMVISFIPLGERKKSVRVSEGEEIKEESQSFVVIFPWIAMALFFVLATASMDITILTCESQVGSIGEIQNGISNVTGSETLSSYNSSTITTSVWTCNETQFYDGPLAWLFVGLAIIMLVYAILATLLWSAGSLVVEVKKLAGSN